MRYQISDISDITVRSVRSALPPSGGVEVIGGTACHAGRCGGGEDGGGGRRDGG